MENLILRTAGSLLFIVALMLGVAWIAKKYLLKGRTAGASGSGMEILSHLPLQPKRSVFMIRVPGKILIIGSAENGLTSLSEVTDATALEQFEATQSDSSKQGQRFADIFKKILHTN